MNKDFDIMISAYLDGELSKDEVASFEAHMNNNLEFSNKVEELKKIINLMNSTPKLETSSSFLNNLDSNISNKTKFNFWFIPDFKMSLSFTFLVLILFFITSNGNNIKKEISSIDKIDNQSLTSFESDTLKNDNFIIKQVKGKKKTK